MRSLTHFLPAKRIRPDLLLLWREILPRYRDLRLLRLLPTPWAILTETRQILFASPSFLQFTDATEDSAFGKRPGEVLSCLHAPGGCGTTEACRDCGAAQAIQKALDGEDAQVQTAFLRRMGEKLIGTNAVISAAPFQVGWTPFALLSILPTNEAKEQEVLERLFFHDLLNGLNAMVGALTLVHEQHTDPTMHEFLTMVLERAWGLVREIRAYKALSAAERSTLSLTLETLDLADLCRQMSAIYRTHPLAHEKHIGVDLPPALPIISDPQLLHRVVENLLKNALEASEPGQTVSLRLWQEHDTVVLAVHNPGVIPAPIQARIFQRGHSSKGSGRGFGTYGVRLFTENYLAGQVYFTSTPEQGTTFWLRLPLRHPLAPRDMEIATPSAL